MVLVGFRAPPLGVRHAKRSASIRGQGVATSRGSGIARWAKDGDVCSPSPKDPVRLATTPGGRDRVDGFGVISGISQWVPLSARFWPSTGRSFDSSPATRTEAPPHTFAGWRQPAGWLSTPS